MPFMLVYVAKKNDKVGLQLKIHRYVYGISVWLSLLHLRGHGAFKTLKHETIKKVPKLNIIYVSLYKNKTKCHC